MNAVAELAAASGEEVVLRRFSPRQRDMRPAPVEKPTKQPLYGGPFPVRAQAAVRARAIVDVTTPIVCRDTRGWWFMPVHKRDEWAENTRLLGHDVLVVGG